MFVSVFFLLSRLQQEKAATKPQRFREFICLAYALNWVAVKELSLMYHIGETILFILHTVLIMVT